MKDAMANIPASRSLRSSSGRPALSPSRRWSRRHYAEVNFRFPLRNK